MTLRPFPTSQSAPTQSTLGKTLKPFPTALSASPSATPSPTTTPGVNIEEPTTEGKSFFGKVKDFFRGFAPAAREFVGFGGVTKFPGQLDRAAQPLTDVTFNTRVGQTIASNLSEGTRDIPLKLYSAARALGSDEAFFQTYQQNYNTLKKKTEGGGLPKRIGVAALSSAPQTALGVMLSFVPVFGRPLSTFYWTALSAGEQIETKGRVESIGNIAVDVLGDRILGDSLTALFRQGSGRLVSVLRSAGIEGSTETAQTFLKLQNDYQRAQTDEEREAVLQEAMDYVRSGDIAVEFGAGAIAGGGIATVVPSGVVSQAQQRAEGQPAPQRTIRPVPQALIEVQEAPVRPQEAQGEAIAQETGVMTTLLQEARKYKSAEEFLSSRTEDVVEQGQFEGYKVKGFTGEENPLSRPYDDFGLDDAMVKWNNKGTKTAKSDLLKLFRKPEGQQHLQKVLDAIPKNPDGTITAYRFGPVPEDGIPSYTLSKRLAENIAGQGGAGRGTHGVEKLITRLAPPPGTSKGVATVAIDPKNVIGWSTFDAEIITKGEAPSLTSLWEQAQKESPTAEGAVPSGIARSIQQKAVDAGITKGFDKLAGYDTTTLKRQAELGAEMAEDVDRLRRVLRGEEARPKEMDAVSVIAAAEELAKSRPELAGDLLYEAANSPLATELSRAAQELGAARLREPDSATARLKAVRDERIKRAGGEERVKEKRKKVLATLKEERKKSVLSAKESFKLDSFIDSIAC